MVVFKKAVFAVVHFLDARMLYIYLANIHVRTRHNSLFSYCQWRIFN